MAYGFNYHQIEGGIEIDDNDSLRETFFYRLLMETSSKMILNILFLIIFKMNCILLYCYQQY